MLNESSAVNEGAVPTPEPAQEEKYRLHLRLDKEMQPRLKQAAELAYSMGKIEKPELSALFDLFITWGINILKVQGLDFLGYR